jgi:molybdopterin converting factor small subunit
MIEIQVRLYGGLGEYSPEASVGEGVTLSLAEDAHISDLVNQLGVPQEKVNLTFINNRQQDDNYQLRDGDRVAFFPLIAGG